MKKTIKCILIIISIILIVFLLFIGRFEYVTRYKITDIDTSVSPNGEYELLYQNVGEPDLPFGYAHVRLVLKKGRETIIKYKFDVADDGGSPTTEQWQVIWKDDRADVLISGEEQPDHLYKLYFNGETKELQPITTTQKGK